MRLAFTITVGLALFALLMGINAAVLWIGGVFARAWFDASLLAFGTCVFLSIFELSFYGLVHVLIHCLKEP